MDAQPSQVFIWLAGSETGAPLLKSIPALEPKYQMFASPWAVAAKTKRQPKMVESSVFKASWVDELKCEESPGFSIRFQR